MKYFIALVILVAFCVNANAQTTASGDDKAAGATIGQNNGYSYGVTYTVEKGKTVEKDAEQVILHKDKVSSEKDIQPAENNSNGRYPYEVKYVSTSEEIVHSGTK